MKEVAALVSLLFLFDVYPALAQPPALPEGAETVPLELQPVQVEPGEILHLSGEGCSSDVDVNLELYNPTLISTGISRTDIDGAFAAEVQIPAASADGRAWVRAKCLSDSGELFLEGVAVVSRSPFALTWVNLLFGAGTFLMVLGFGLIIKRAPGHSRSGRKQRKHRRRR